jgi:tetrapyrrole methylase family protein/MazG family protein
MPRVTVVGLGPAGPDLVTEGTLAAIRAVPVRFVRTNRHPSVGVLGTVTSFDALYEAASSIEDVYGAIVDALVAAASAETDGHVLYAVPGSPAVAERTVELLRADPRVDVEVLPALSCLDLTWTRLGVDPLSQGVRVVDGHRFATDSAGERGPLLVLQCDRPTVLSEIKLALDERPDLAAPSPGPITVLQRLGLPDEAVFVVDWDDLDREVAPDHLTSLWIPELAAPVGQELVRLAELVRTLRQRCPWDARQTHQTLTRHLLEETYEVLEAIDGLNADLAGGEGFDHLCEELGDLLFQVYFHATLAAEEGQFTLADVARGIHDKLVHRHPHVFAADEIDGDRVVPNWEQIKRAEKGRDSLMAGIPGALPSLLYAHKVQSRAASVGFDWDSVDGAYPKVTEELDELRSAAAPGGSMVTAEIADEMGDLLFACVNVARHLDVDPEAALRAATAKFRTRFTAVEGLAAERGIDMTGAGLSVLDGLWDEVKASQAAAS